MTTSQGPAQQHIDHSELSLLKTPPLKDLEALSQHSFFKIFRSLDPTTIARLETTEAYPANHTIFRQNDHSNGAYLVLKGHVRAAVADPLSGNEIEVTSFKKGDFFGEYGTLDDGPRSATTITTAPTVLTFIPQSDLLALFDRVKQDELLDFARNTIAAVLCANDSFVQQAARASIGIAAAQLAHDIRNPLTIFTTAPELLARRNKELDISRATDELLRFGASLTSLVDAIMSASRDSRLNQTINPPTDLSGGPTDPYDATTYSSWLSQLAKNQFFSVFSQEDPRKTLENGILSRFKAGDVIFHEGATSSEIYLHLLGGPVEISRARRSGKPITVAHIEEGDFLGHYKIFGAGERSATARATTDSTLLMLPVAHLHTLLHRAEASDLVALTKHIIKEARQGNRHFASQNRLVEMVDRTLHFATRALPMINDMRDVLSELQVKPGLHDPTSLISKMERELNRIRAVLDNLKTCSTGEIGVNPAPIDVSQIFDEISASLGIVFEREHLNLSLSSIEKAVVWDGNQILRVLENLTRNAKEAVPQDNGEVWVKAEDLGSSVRLTVADNGPGLPFAIKTYPFQMFLTQCRPGGTGLGLAICKTIVEAHKGTITFADRDGGGTIFTIEIPCHPRF